MDDRMLQKRLMSEIECRTADETVKIAKGWLQYHGHEWSRAHQIAELRVTYLRDRTRANYGRYTRARREFIGYVGDGFGSYGT